MGPLNQNSTVDFTGDFTAVKSPCRGTPVSVWDINARAGVPLERLSSVVQPALRYRYSLYCFLYIEVVPLEHADANQRKPQIFLRARLTSSSHEKRAVRRGEEYLKKWSCKLARTPSQTCRLSYTQFLLHFKSISGTHVPLKTRQDVAAAVFLHDPPPATACQPRKRSHLMARLSADRIDSLLGTRVR